MPDKEYEKLQNQLENLLGMCLKQEKLHTNWLTIHDERLGRHDDRLLKLENPTGKEMLTR